MVLCAPHLPWGSGAPPKKKQRGLYMRVWICTMMLCASAAMAEPATMIERFDAGAGERWRYIGDNVMGGVSSGQAQIGAQGLHLTGQVST
ncbi:MAG TPA: hypothetical protein DHC76_21115, partial [Rhodobacteraceae bacterium]|nr:hypothetical protein [Paracoccaceae bacterium]